MSFIRDLVEFIYRGIILLGYATIMAILILAFFIVSGRIVIG